MDSQSYIDEVLSNIDKRIQNKDGNDELIKEVKKLQEEKAQLQKQIVNLRSEISQQLDSNQFDRTQDFELTQ